MGMQPHPSQVGGIVPPSYGNQGFQGSHPGANLGVVDSLRQMVQRPSGYVHQQAPGYSHTMQNTPRWAGGGSCRGVGVWTIHSNSTGLSTVHLLRIFRLLLAHIVFMEFHFSLLFLAHIKVLNMSHLASLPSIWIQRYQSVPPINWTLDLL